jgi:transglutaminase-like putative cysteine protease
MLRELPWNDEARRLVWVLACLVVALVPHIANVPAWVLLAAAAGAIWRVAAALRDWRLPPRWIRILFAFISVSLIAVEFRTLNGLEAGTALLVLMAGVKLIETRGLRDLAILLFLCYFLLFAALLYEQSLPWLPYMIGATVLLTATLLKVHGAGARIGARPALRLTLRMLAVALPVAVILFVFFPRLPGQFWALPARAGAVTGLSDEMSPGDLSELSLNDAPAIRVTFHGAVPPPNQRYWRGPVLHNFDGRAWRRLRSPYLTKIDPKPIGRAYEYKLTLEPHNRRWLIALDMVDEWPQSQAYRTFDYQLHTIEPVSTLKSFEMVSYPRYDPGQDLPKSVRKVDLDLPDGMNPRTQAFAAELREKHPADEQLIQAVLRHFRREEFFYTLEPPGLAANAVDDFLFNTRRGFCEHFASAFTALMRAAGIPARVVTGYQGGTVNPYWDYLLVRQSDAHAWSEVWLEGKGWTRVDPTAAVAPDRIEIGLDAALPEGEPVPGRLISRVPLLASLDFAWDALNAFWNDQIVEFDARSQAELLENFGIDDADWRALGAAMAMTLAAFFAAMTAYLAWLYRPRRRDPAREVYERLCRRLAVKGLPQHRGEGPNDYLERVATSRPELAAEIEELRRLYISMRYAPGGSADQLSRLRFVASRLRV